MLDIAILFKTLQVVMLEKGDNKNMKYLVTGGAGFIGSHTVEQLIREGHHIRVLDNFSSGIRENLVSVNGNPNIEIIEGDVRDAALVQRLATGMDGVLHLAALVSVQESVTNPELCLDINVRGTCNVLDAARRADVRRVILASSAGVYGDNAKLPLSEEAASQPLSSYAMSKYVGELYAELYHRLYGLETTALRYFNVYGPRQNPLSPYSGVISIFVHRTLAGKGIIIYGDGSQTRDFVHVEDVAAANLASLRGSYRGFRTYNVGSGQATSINQLAELLMTLGGVRVGIDRQPSRQGDIQHSCADFGRLRAELGCSPRHALERGLRDLILAMDGGGRSASTAR